MKFNDPKDLFAVESRYKEELFIIHYNRNIILQDEKSYNHNLNLVMEFLNQCIHNSYYDEDYTELKPSLTTIYEEKISK